MLEATFLSDKPDEYPVLLRSDVKGGSFSSKVYWWEPHPWGSNNIFDYVPKETLLTEDFFIIVDCSPDAVYQDFIERTYLWTIFQFFRDNKISLKRLIVLTPSPEYLFMEKERDYKHLFFSPFWFMIQKAYLKNDFTNLPKKNITKTYFTLMRKDTKSRCLLNYMLHKKEIHDKGFVTHNRVNPKEILVDEVSLSSMLEAYPKIDQKVLLDKGLSKHVIDGNSIPTFNDRIFNDHQIRYSDLQFNLTSKTFLEVIVEPLNLDRMFFTEKTLKAFLTKSIFIMFNTQNSLKFLRGLGFKTFGETLDESYDEISNQFDRVSAFVDEIKRLSCLSTIEQTELYINNTEIVEHNFTHFITQDWSFNLHNRIKRHIDETVFHSH